MSIVRWNLKKVRTAKRYAEEHEAHRGDPSGQDGQNRDEPSTDTEYLDCRCDGDERERLCALPGEISLCA